LFFVFTVSDDRKIQGQVEQEFQDWRKKGKYSDVTGLLLYIGQAGVQLLEGPTELLHKALECFNSLTVEDSSRPQLVSGIRVLHFTELHAVRVSVGWSAYSHQSKLVGGAAGSLEEGNCAEMVLLVYQKFLGVCLKVAEQADDEVDWRLRGVDFGKLQGLYKKQADMLPSADDTLILLSKNGADLFFSYAEFEKVFVAPFNCVLHSELLWPMPPALSY